MCVGNKMRRLSISRVFAYLVLLLNIIAVIIIITSFTINSLKDVSCIKEVSIDDRKTEFINYELINKDFNSLTIAYEELNKTSNTENPNMNVVIVNAKGISKINNADGIKIESGDTSLNEVNKLTTVFDLKAKKIVNNSNWLQSTLTDNDISLIEKIAKDEYLLIEKELQDYNFTAGKHLPDLTMISGGEPIRSVVFTSWRCGSTFLGEILNSIPGNYYHYEPFLDYDIKQMRGEKLEKEALNRIRGLLKCDYNNEEAFKRYLDFGKSHCYLFIHNYRLWNICTKYYYYCFHPTFLSALCKVFPFQSFKTTRVRASLAEGLLKDKSLNVRVLLLVRDPRGTLQSRKHRNWCPGKPDCDQPSLLCSDMSSDYEAAKRLTKLYPDTFRAIRYEDFSLDPYQGVNDLFDFFQLSVHPRVKEFLDSHTTTNVGGVSSTFRNSKSAPFHWRLDLNYSEVQSIESQCFDAMKKWGYVRAYNESTLKEMNPLTEYSLLDGS